MKAKGFRDKDISVILAELFGMNKNDMEDQERKKWKSTSKQYEGLSGKPRTVKHDKHGNPIYPVRGPQEEYLIVDGYNVIHASKELSDLFRENMDAARTRLEDEVSNYQGFDGAETIIVFDAYNRKNNAGRTMRKGNIAVVFTKEDQTADAYIEKFTHDHREKDSVRVVTSDNAEQTIAIGNGAIRVSSREFLKELKKAHL